MTAETDRGGNARRAVTAGAEDRLTALFAAVNAADLVQPGWYQRSHGAYELICYLNNAMGLYLAGNFDAVPIFLDRALGYLSREDAVRFSDAYRQAVMDYLAELARATAAREALSDRSRSFIPASLLGDTG